MWDFFNLISLFTALLTQTNSDLLQMQIEQFLQSLFQIRGTGKITDKVLLTWLLSMTMKNQQLICSLLKWEIEL